MRVRNWYKSDGWGAFREFCIENRYDLISAKQIDELEPVKGALYDYRFWPISTAGVFILLAYTVIHLHSTLGTSWRACIIWAHLQH
jgi:hypothetical protein